LKVNSPQIDENRQAINKLLQKQRNEIALRETELDNIQKIYKKKEDQERLVGEKKLLDIHDRNNKEFLEANKSKEEKLAQIKEQFSDTQQKLSLHESELKKGHENRIMNARDNHNMQAQRIFEDAQEQLKDINLTTNSKIKDVNAKTDLELTRIKHKSQLAIDKAAHENSLRVTQEQNGQADALKVAQKQFYATQQRQEMEHKNALAEQHLKNNGEFQTRERIHKDRTDATEKHYNELIKGEKSSFEMKYQRMVKEHQSVLDRLQSTFKERLDKITSSFKSEHAAKSARSEDEFYSLHTLSPKVREDEKFYYVDIETPPHEKENYHITAHGRKIKVQFNRRSEERLDGKNGEVQTSKRSETLSKEINVAHIVDDKKVKVAYEEGVLSYRLPKA